MQAALDRRWGTSHPGWPHKELVGNSWMSRPQKGIDKGKQVKGAWFYIEVWDSKTQVERFILGAG